MRDFGSKRAPTSSRDEQATAAGPGPGKRTLTEMLPATGSPVQRKADTAPAMPTGPRPSIEVFGAGGQRKATGAEHDTEQIHREADAEAGVQPGVDRAVDRAAGSSGAPLPAAVRGRFEASLGTDLSGVRVHTGAESADAATAVGARAYTIGQDIHFNTAQYDPGSQTGQHLLAHEVAHTVQQQGTTARPQAKGERPEPTSSWAEHDADRAASAMVAGQSASVTPIAEQAPHAKEYSRAELIAAYNSSLARQDWNDVALRLNGFSDDDIKMLVGKLTAGQKTHVREGAEVAMPGWSQRVTGAIDDADADAARIAALYAAYEKAVVAAKSSGDWHEVIDRLNGMGDWDIQDRLKKLTWFDYEAMRAQTDNKRVLAAIGKADTARVQRVYDAYETAIKAQNWRRAVNQLHGMSDEDVHDRLDTLASAKETTLFLKRLKEAAVAQNDTRIVKAIDQVAEEHGDVVPDPLVVTPLALIPDISEDTRELKSSELANFAGNGKIAKFADDLSAAYGAQYAKNTHSDKKKPSDAATKHAQLVKSWEDTARHYIGQGYFKTVAEFGKRWMSEMAERADWDSGPEIFVATPKKTDIDQLSPDKLVHIAAPGSNPDGKQPVHPFVNEFMARLGSGFTATTYQHHGESKSKDGTYPGDWAPLCLDVKPKIATDARGLYEPNQIMDFIERINAAAGGPANWSGIYNDTAVARGMATRGLANKIDSTAQDGSHNFHGALNLHIHLYLRPPDGWAPGDPGSAPRVDPANEPH